MKLGIKRKFVTKARRSKEFKVKLGVKHNLASVKGNLQLKFKVKVNLYESLVSMSKGT